MPFSVSVGVLFEEGMAVFAINQFAEKGASTRGGDLGSVWGRMDRTERSHLKFPHVLTFINFHVKLVLKAHMRK